ncbi:MAG: transcriptional regulator [Candidatus Caldarchaeales archaeon]
MSLLFEEKPPPTPWRTYLVPINILKLHEEISEEHALRLFEEIVRDGYLKRPLLVENRYYIILDGHHRYAVLEKLGAKLTPIFLVDYASSMIEVYSWRSDWNITKEMVIEAGISGRRLPFKTSRHVLKGVDIPDINISISRLVREHL